MGVGGHEALILVAVVIVWHALANAGVCVLLFALCEQAEDPRFCARAAAASWAERDGADHARGVAG
jgi:hypothetical protein